MQKLEVDQPAGGGSPVGSPSDSRKSGLTSILENSDNTFNNISIRLLIPKKFNFDGINEIYENWNKRTQLERISDNNFFKLLGPMMVACAHGVVSAPVELKKDSEAAMVAIRETYRREQIGVERVCICYVLWFSGHILDSRIKDGNDYSLQIREHYKNYVNFATGADWNTCVLPGTKMATLLIHYVRICAGSELDDLESITNLIINHWSQIEHFTGGLKQVPVAVFLAFETANQLLLILEKSLKKYFTAKLVRILDWAQKTMREIKVFPMFTEACLEYFRACRSATKDTQDAMMSLGKLAQRAKQENMLLLYTNAMANVTLLKMNKQIRTDVVEATKDTGIAAFANARLQSAKEFHAQRRENNKNKAAANLAESMMGSADSAMTKVNMMSKETTKAVVNTVGA